MNELKQMKKWYVHSGSLQTIVEAETPKEAMKKALLRNDGPFGILISAHAIKPNETQDDFEKWHDNDYVSSTKLLCEELDIEVEEYE